MVAIERDRREDSWTRRAFYVTDVGNGAAWLAVLRGRRTELCAADPLDFVANLLCVWAFVSSALVDISCRRSRPQVRKT